MLARTNYGARIAQQGDRTGMRIAVRNTMIECGDIRWLRAISKAHSRVHRGPVPQEPLERLVELGLAERKVNRFKLTRKGRLVLEKLG